MIKGFDTTESVLGHCKAIKDAQYSFIIKYGAVSSTFPDKRFTHLEIAELKKNGLSAGFVWERGNTIDSFTSSKGEADAKEFVAYLKLLGVPANNKICGYFAVDLDVTRVQVMGPIAAYFKSAWAVMKSAGYLTGVYGSGIVCQGLQNLGVAHYGWKANASGWAGFDYTGCQITQSTGHVMNFDSDPDTAINLEGFWTP